MADHTSPTGTSSIGDQPTTQSGATPGVAGRYRAAAAALSAVADAIGVDDWDRPSPCDGWSAADLIIHLVETQQEFLARFVPGIGSDAAPAEDLAQRWRTHAATVARYLDDDAVTTLGFDGFFGPTTVGDTIDQFYVFDMIIHRWDLAVAAGPEAAAGNEAPGGSTLSDDEMDRIEAGVKSWGPALYSPGICKPAVAVGQDADRQTRLLATLGRSTNSST